MDTAVPIILLACISGSPLICHNSSRTKKFWSNKTKSRKGATMQNGSIMRSKRLKGPDVWEFRWRESGPDGKRKQRRMVVGSIRQFADESAALRTISALRRDINLGNPSTFTSKKASR